MAFTSTIPTTGSSIERADSLVLIFNASVDYPDTMDIYVNRFGYEELAFQTVDSPATAHTAMGGFSVERAEGSGIIAYVVRSAVGWPLDTCSIRAYGTGAGPSEYTVSASYTVEGEETGYASPHTIVDDGLALLLYQFKDSPQLNALIESYLVEVRKLAEAAYSVAYSRGLDIAIADRLDGIGAILLVDRAGRSDDDYRRRLKAELAILKSSGTGNELINILYLLLALPGKSSVELHEYSPEAVYIRPIDWVLTNDPASVGASLRRAIASGYRLLFVYSLENDANTFQLSSSGALQTSATAGFGPNVSIGGPGAPVWIYQASSTILTGLGPGLFRFNSADHSQATQIFVHTTDAAAVDQSAFLGSLAGGDTLHIANTGLPKYIGAYVTSTIDHGTAFTINVEVRSKVGTYLDTSAPYFAASTTGGSLAGTA